MVVYDVGQVICGQLIGALIEHLIVKYVALNNHFAAYQVVHVHLFARFYLETHHILLALLHQLVHLIGRHGERVAHRHAGRSVVLKVGDSLSLGLKFLGLVESNVSLAAVEQYFDILLVYLSPLTLPVGAFVAPKAHALVELDAEPLK